MSLAKKLIPLATLSLLISCQTQNLMDIKSEAPNYSLSNSSNTTTDLTPKQNQQQIKGGNSSIYPVNNYNGYYYKNGFIYIVGFPKTIIDEIYEGDYKIIKAR